MPTLTEKLTSTDEGMRTWQQERLILDITERICQMMTASDMKRADLAEKLGKSRAHISQLLDGNANMTIRMVSDLFWAFDRAAKIVDEPLLDAVNCEPKTHSHGFVLIKEVDLGTAVWIGADTQESSNPAQMKPFSPSLAKGLSFHGRGMPDRGIKHEIEIEGLPQFNESVVSQVAHGK